MNKALFAALAAVVSIAAGWSGPAEARCFRIGQHWSCTAHRMHYAQRLHHRSFAAGYGYRYGYGYPAYYAGGGYPYSGSSYSGSGLGPPAGSAGGP